MQLLDVSMAILVLLLAFYLSRWFKYRGKKLPPGPLGLPVVGYLPFLSPTRPHHSLSQLCGKFGPIYSVRLGSVFTVVLSDVKLVRQAFAMESLSGRAPLYLTHGIMKGNVRDGEKILRVGLRKPNFKRHVQGIICVQGEKWREQRKFVVTCLRNFGMVKFGEKRNKMETDIKMGVAQFVGKLEETKGKPTDPAHSLMHSLGNVVFNLVFGKMWDEGDEVWNELINLQEEGTKLIGIAGPINFIPFLRFLPKYQKIINYIQNGITYSHDIYRGILEEYRSTCNNKCENENPSHFLGCFNNEMIKKENEKSFYTLPQFNYLMADLWGAGVDTTITTLRWFLLYIAHYTEYQKNIQKEMDEVIGEREISLDDVQFLPFFQASMSEVQRIRSVTPMGIPHGAVEDCTLNGYYIPKGTMVVPLQWAIHMNPKYCPNPDSYNPNRFIGEDGKFTKPDYFIPFQTGKRMCLGEEYAKMLLYLYAGTLLQKFSFSLEKEPDFEGESGITLTPKAHNIKFLSRAASK